MSELVFKCLISGLVTTGPTGEVYTRGSCERAILQYGCLQQSNMDRKMLSTHEMMWLCVAGLRTPVFLLGFMTQATFRYSVVVDLLKSDLGKVN